LGAQRLKDLDEPERLYQVLAPGLIREFPPLRSLGTRRGNMPLQMSSFIGRMDDLVAVTTALEETRLVTLTGVGGVGKTRLALRHTRRQRRDGVTDVLAGRQQKLVDAQVAEQFRTDRRLGRQRQAVVPAARGKRADRSASLPVVVPAKSPWRGLRRP
jgi:hypothetical protein